MSANTNNRSTTAKSSYNLSLLNTIVEKNQSRYHTSVLVTKSPFDGKFENGKVKKKEKKTKMIQVWGGFSMCFTVYEIKERHKPDHIHILLARKKYILAGNKSAGTFILML